MKVFVVLSALVAVAVAAPSGAAILAGPAVYAATPLVSQYHSQDELGQYSYGYSGGPSAKTETKTFDGITRGAYSYIDANGLLQSVEYTADPIHGFRAAATNLPVAPVDTGVAPEPVKDTPEVVAARAQHLAAIDEAKIKSAELPVVETKIVKEPELIAPVTRLAAPIAAPLAAPVLLRASETIPTPLRFGYSYAAPAYYNYAAPYSFAYPGYTGYTTYASPFIARAYPWTIPAAVLPAPVTDTPEVAKAKEEHLGVVVEAKSAQ
ncbi:cuticle protein 19.8-like [Lutzomyia longipalpis]|uniref:Cuticle protein n=2 Tax=Lutzomyia longipalpis TaxID=7200 RepID=A0A1B0CQL8_LUTLO|nr:cuticle protein 19.8-like [Lutzomyia longipalpis]